MNVSIDVHRHVVPPFLVEHASATTGARTLKRLMEQYIGATVESNLASMARWKIDFGLLSVPVSVILENSDNDSTTVGKLCTRANDYMIDAA